MPTYLHSGHQYGMFVLPAAAGGSDTNDGRTPSSAKATIEGALVPLRAGFPNRGGRITMLGSGSNHAAGQDVDQAGVKIEFDSSETARILVGSGDGYGIRFGPNAENCQLVDARIEAASSTAVVGGILVDGPQRITLVRPYVFGFGNGIDADTVVDPNASAYGIKVRSDSVTYSDWHVIDKPYVRNCFHGITCPGGGTNGVIWDPTIRGSKQAAMWLRDSTMGQGGTVETANWRVIGGYLAGVSSNTVDNWVCRCDASAAEFVGTKFECNPELVTTTADPPAAGTGAAGHVLLDANATSCQFTACQFVGGATISGGGPTAVRFAAGAAGNEIGQHHRQGSGWGLPDFRAATATEQSNNKVWTEADYTGTITVA